MRFGIVLAEPWAQDARLAEELGFEVVWIDERASPAPLIVAASLAATTEALRIVVCLTAGSHPVEIAEEAAVTDLALGGRLVLAMQSDDDALLAETVELLTLSLTARPFRHAGPCWTVPARLPEHELAPSLARVTPAPAQLELPIWSGAQVPTPVVLDAESFDPTALVAQLRDDQLHRARDLAVFETAATGAERAALLGRIGREVRPRLQLSELPPGLEDYWAGDDSPG